jgi:gamma-glutamyl-gamma-aminobutyrate hydrolase PuuD
MYEAEGWAVIPHFEDADLIQFLGGEDVTPQLYGEATHPTTDFNIQRDRYEMMVFKLALQKGKKMAGICRGGQFLNVMNGGRMFQHINGHATGKQHWVYCNAQNSTFEVTSTHHQMMRPNLNGNYEILLEGFECSEWQLMSSDGTVLKFSENPTDHLDVEAIIYPDTDCLCYQPHPEYLRGEGRCRDTFFYYIFKYLNLGIIEERFECAG